VRLSPESGLRTYPWGITKTPRDEKGQRIRMLTVAVVENDAEADGKAFEVPVERYNRRDRPPMISISQLCHEKDSERDEEGDGHVCTYMTPVSPCLVDSE